MEKSNSGLSNLFLFSNFFCKWAANFEVIFTFQQLVHSEIDGQTMLSIRIDEMCFSTINIEVSDEMDVDERDAMSFSKYIRMVTTLWNFHSQIYTWVRNNMLENRIRIYSIYCTCNAAKSYLDSTSLPLHLSNKQPSYAVIKCCLQISNKEDNIHSQLAFHE